MQEAALISPAGTINGVDVADCRMTRSELQKRLAECAFGRNHVIFDAYFRWSEGTKGQPYCNVCFRPIGVHGDGAVSSASPPPAAPAPAAPSTLYQPTPLTASSPPSGYSQSATMQLYPGYPPPPLGQPIGGIPFYTHPSTMYQPPVYVQPWGGLYGHAGGAAPAPVGIPYPMKMVAGDGAQQPDVLNEGFHTFNLIIAGVFLFFFASSLAAALGLLGDYDNDVDGVGHSTSRGRSDPYVFIVSAVWGLIALVYAYRCKTFCCRVCRGRQIWSEETRLLTIMFASKKTSMEWAGIAAGGGIVEVVTDPTAGLCCFGAQWVLIVLRPTQGCCTSNGEPVLLARCSRGIVDVEARAWTAYIDALRQPMGRSQRQL